MPLAFLERLSRPLLLRLLGPHAAALSAHAFPLDALAASAQTDRTHVLALFRLLASPPPADLAPLHETLLSVADLATHSSHELLLVRDTERLLDHELGAEDCAATAYLDHRPLFSAARPQAASSQPRAFASFEPSTPRPLPEGPPYLKAFTRGMSTALESRGRSNYFRVHEWRIGIERHMELRFGRLSATRDVLGKREAGAAHDVTAQVTDRTSESALAVFHDDTMRLDVAGPDWMKDLVRRHFGLAFFGSEDHFEGGGTVTLSPLANLDAALSTCGVPGLARVELQKVWIDLGDGSGGMALWGKNTCRNGAAGGYLLRALLDGTAFEATFHLFLAGRARPITLVIVAPQRLTFDRRDPRVVQIVREWVVAAGYMRLPELLRTTAGGERDELDAFGASEVAAPLEQRASE